MKRWIALVGLVGALIVIPFMLFGSSIERWSIGSVQALSQRPALAAFLVAGLLAADVVLPVPSSVVSTLAGAVLGMAAGTAASWLGMTAGCLVGYGLGRMRNGPAITRLLGTRELARLEVATARYGDWALVLARGVPVLAEASTVFAGIGRMPLRRFLAVSGLANLGISLVYSAAGAYAARVQSFLLALAAAITLPAIAAAVVRLGRSDLSRSGPTRPGSR